MKVENFQNHFRSQVFYPGNSVAFKIASNTRLGRITEMSIYWSEVISVFCSLYQCNDTLYLKSFRLLLVEDFSNSKYVQVAGLRMFFLLPGVLKCMFCFIRQSLKFLHGELYKQPILSARDLGKVRKQSNIWQLSIPASHSSALLGYRRPDQLDLRRRGEAV